MLSVVSFINILANLLLLKLSLQVHWDAVVAAELKMSHHRLDAEHADLFLRYQIRGLTSRSSCSAAESIRALNASSAARTIRDSALRLTKPGIRIARSAARW